MIDHSKLLETLETIGITGNLHKLFVNYFQNRKICVKIFDHYSKKKNVFAGVPQGSILGPTLYVIYVTAMKFIFSHVKHYVYADDTALVISHEDLLMASTLLQIDFVTLQKWSHDVGLIINAKKTKLMHIRSPHNNITITPKIVSHDFNCIHKSVIQPCSCKNIELVSKYVYLGLTIDCNFKWDIHIQKVCTRLRAIVSKLYRLKFFVPPNTLRIVYLSLAESLIRYGITSWGHSTKTNLLSVQNVQYSLLKLLLNKDKYEQRHDVPKSLLYNSVNLLSVRAILWLKIASQHTSQSEHNKIVTHVHNTRLIANDGLVVPRYLNKYGQRTLEYLVPIIYNMLPNSIKSCELTLRRKYMLKKWLCERIFLY